MSVKILKTINLGISEESLQNIKNERIEYKNKLNNDNLTFKEYYNLCIKARMSSKETLEGLKNFIVNKINNGVYKIFEINKDAFEVFEAENLICRLYKICDIYYIPPDSIQIHGLYQERD